ncbi:hypothetical protein BRADI_2g26556v3 [Brachypodium distachyon]|uniref:Uncharacterized protein n=1 Tax=Brachypodium distachyon TaxID=15368 RepID=A0A2K2DAQ1_BRADI|nr:hypothetical protein BRADI_2g26556v3 [Brachypodium distachyon]
MAAWKTYLPYTHSAATRACTIQGDKTGLGSHMFKFLAAYEGRAPECSHIWSPSRRIQYVFHKQYLQ